MKKLTSVQLIQFLSENREEVLCVTVRGVSETKDVTLVMGLVDEDNLGNSFQVPHLEVFDYKADEVNYCPLSMWESIHRRFVWSVLEIQVEEPENFSDALEQEMWQKIENL